MEIIERSITIDGAVIYYQLCGDPARQPFVFLHGWPGYLLEKSGVLQELRKYFYVIAPMHPGLRKSDPLPHYTNIFEQYADVVHKILQVERLDRARPVIMGQSFGGGVASAYAYQYPENTRALILTDSTMVYNRRDLWSRLMFGYGDRFIRALPYLPQVLQKQVLFMVFGVVIDEHTDWKKLRQSFSKYVAMVGSFLIVLRCERAADRKLIDKNYGSFPIIMVWGDRDGREFNMYGYCPVDEAKELAEEMKEEGRDVIFFTVHGGHTILYERPAYVVGEIMNTLPRNN